MTGQQPNPPPPATGNGKFYAALAGTPIGGAFGVLASGICTYDWPALFPVGGSMAEAVSAVAQGLVTGALVLFTPHNIGGS